MGKAESQGETRREPTRLTRLTTSMVDREELVLNLSNIF